MKKVVQTAKQLRDTRRVKLLKLVDMLPARDTDPEGTHSFRCYINYKHAPVLYSVFFDDEVATFVTKCALGATINSELNGSWITSRKPVPADLSRLLDRVFLDDVYNDVGADGIVPFVKMFPKLRMDFAGFFK